MAIIFATFAQDLFLIFNLVGVKMAGDFLNKRHLQFHIKIGIGQVESLWAILLPGGSASVQCHTIKVETFITYIEQILWETLVSTKNSGHHHTTIIPNI